MMSYVDEVIDLVVKKNPAEPEFHQAVKEVLESLRVVVEKEKSCRAGISPGSQRSTGIPASSSRSK